LLGDTFRRVTTGVWRSLVARAVRDGKVAGSNPVTPTTGKGRGIARRSHGPSSSPWAGAASAERRPWQSGTVANPPCSNSDIADKHPFSESRRATFSPLNNNCVTTTVELPYHGGTRGNFRDFSKIFAKTCTPLVKPPRTAHDPCTYSGRRCYPSPGRTHRAAASPSPARSLPPLPWVTGAGPARASSRTPLDILRGDGERDCHRCSAHLHEARTGLPAVP